MRFDHRLLIFLLGIIFTILINNSSAVNSCYSGAYFAGSLGSIFNSNLTKVTCPLGITDACLKIYGNSYAYYNCTTTGYCESGYSISTPFINLPGLTAIFPTKSVCCYTDNCNSSNSIKHSLVALFLSFVIGVYFCQNC